MDDSMAIILAPQYVFGGDVAERITNGNFEGAGSQADGAAPGWIISQTPGHAVTASINVATVHGGLSAQQVLWGTTANGTIGFAQQINGLDTNNTYGATAWIKVLSLSSSLYNDIVFRVGPNSGSPSYQASVTASNTADYQKLTLSWSNTAASVWLWVASITKKDVEKVFNGGFENGFVNGVGSGWIAHSALTPSVDVTNVNAGASAQKIITTSAATLSQSLAQQVTGLSVNVNYEASASIYIYDTTGRNQHVTVFRVGPNSGGADWQSSATARTQGAYALASLTWSNTASSVWIWVADAATANYVANSVSNSGFEAWSAATADVWNAAGIGVTSIADNVIFYNGLSANKLLFSTTANGLQSFAQDLAALSTGNNYLASLYIRQPNLTAAAQHDVMFRVGPASASATTNWQTSTTASKTAGSASFEQLTLSWANTAATIGIWVTDRYTADKNEMVTSGDMEGDYTGGIQNAWIAHAGLTGQAERSITAGGASAQFLMWSNNINGEKAFAQEITGLTAGQTYAVTAAIRLATLSTSQNYNTVLRLGPNSASESYQISLTATTTGAYESLSTTLHSTANNIWLWVTSNWIPGTPGSASSVTAGAYVDSVSIRLNQLSNTAIIDAVNVTLSAAMNTVSVDTVTLSITGSASGGALIDDATLRSSSANFTDSNTATNAIRINSPWWSLLTPNGLSTPASGTTFRLQVNNANAFDASKAHHYVAPNMYGHLSVSNEIGNQLSASANDFESNWVYIGDLTASAYIGTGLFRWVRVVNLGGFTGAASAFKSYLWAHSMIPDFR